MNQARINWKKSWISIGLICLFAISLLSALYLSPVQQEMPKNSASINLDAPPITTSAMSTSYALRTPVAYDVGSQPLSILGDLPNLAQEANALILRQDFSGTSTGSTYVIFTLSTSGMTLDSTANLLLNWEVWGFGTVIGFATETKIEASIEYQGATWMSVHNVSSTDENIEQSYGWFEFEIPQPYPDYIVSNQIRLRFELSQSLSTSMTWSQYFYIQWLVLEFQQNVSRNIISASQLTLLTPNATSTGGTGSLLLEDAVLYEVEHTNPGASGTLQILLEYDLGLYGLDPLLGIRFSHMDWIEIKGAVSYSYMGRIYLVGESSNTFLCYLRAFTGEPVTPDVKHGTFMALGNPIVNQSIKLLYDIQYTLSGSGTLHVYLDWARLCIVRNPNPIVLTSLLSNTIYVDETIELNITCLDGQAPISKVTVEPWSEIVGSTAGSYEYSRFIGTAGDIALAIEVEDAGGNVFTFPVDTLHVIHRPISIALYLSEDSYTQEFNIYFEMRDLLLGSPLALFPFSKTILKNGNWFRQQNHQTTPTGTFSTSESVVDYLDWNYTVIIDTTETPVYEATSVSASIILSDATPYLTLNDLIYIDPLKASNDMMLNYTILCQAPLSSLWLYRNVTPFLSLPVDLGLNNFTFQDITGTWEYFLYAESSRGQIGFSGTTTVTINPLNTSITLDSTLSMDQHALVLDIELIDELNRSCSGVLLDLIIYDNGEVFYQEAVITGLDGVQLLVHFDQYVDHSFTIEITSETNAVYKGAVVSKSGLSYSGYPLYTVIEVGIAVGVVAVVLCIIKRRFRTR